MAIVPYLIIAGPFLFIYLLPVIGTLPGLKEISRNSNDIATGNSRFIMWNFCSAEFSHVRLFHIIGYGEYGHYASGVSKHWAPFFTGWTNPELKTPHNSFFSILFDYGYIGLFAYVAVLSRSINRIIKSWRIRRDSCMVYLAFYIYYVIGGITDVFSGFYFFNFMYVFVIIVIAEQAEYQMLKNAAVIQIKYQT